MQSPLKTIKELIPYLTPKDAELAKKFYDAKDWESLKDLTWSALQLVETAHKKGISNKHSKLDSDKILELAVTCMDYYHLIYPEENLSEEDCEELEEDEF